LGFDLTIGIIHVIAQQIQKTERASLSWQKVLPTEKYLVTSFWSIFQISRQPRRIRKNRDPPKIFVDAGVSF